MSTHMLQPTPITYLKMTSARLSADVYCKRDDLIDLDGGGSKVRMLRYILSDVSPDKYDVVVTAGGPCSNFNRACALACARLRVSMHLVVYTDKQEEYKYALNFAICQNAGVEVTYCQKNQVSDVIRRVKNQYERDRKRVKLVYGGGRSVEGVYSYFKAVEELRMQISSVDHIFVACGTGTTLAGIGAGVKKFFPCALVHGISVARTWEVERPVLQENLLWLTDFLGESLGDSVDGTLSNIRFYDQYLHGGYGEGEDKLRSDIQACLCDEGMLVDPIYVGKTWHGMRQIIADNPNAFVDKKIVFWNTGGLFTLFSSMKKFN